MVRVSVINPPHNSQPQAQANIAAGSYQGYPQPEPDMPHGRGSQVDMSEYWVSLWPLG